MVEESEDNESYSKTGCVGEKGSGGGVNDGEGNRGGVQGGKVESLLQASFE